MIYFTTEHIGYSPTKPASILEVTLHGFDYVVTENVLDVKTNKVDKYIINNLRELADEFQEHNDSVDIN